MNNNNKKKNTHVKTVEKENLLLKNTVRNSVYKLKLVDKRDFM